VKTVGVLVFDEVEVLDFCGPFEVFSVTRLDEGNGHGEPSQFRVLLIAEHSPVITAGNMRVLPDCSLEDCPPLDVLLIPGGWGTRREMSNKRLLDWIRLQSQQAQLTTSVCTGALLLAAAGLLNGCRATTHYAALGLLREKFPEVLVADDLQLVHDGDVITSAGISAGIDLALLVVARYCGEAVARATARHMEYPYPETNERRVPVH
jgi:transcriptional regulator GlxA family with amidase domain